MRHIRKRSPRFTFDSLEPRLVLSVRPGGSAFVANTYQQATVTQPTIGVAPDGTVTVLWVDWELDGSGKGIYARRYDSAGSPLGAQYRINTSASGDQTAARIAYWPDGSSVVAWVHSPNPGSERPEFYVRAQKLSSTGAKVGDEVVVNTGLPFNFSIRDPDPRIVLHADGGFAILYNDQPSNLPPGWTPYFGDYITASYDASGNLLAEVNEVLTPAEDGWENFRGNENIAVGADGTIYVGQLQRRHRHDFIPDVGPYDRYDIRLVVTPLTPTGHRSAPDWVVDQVMDTPDAAIYDKSAYNGTPNVPRLFKNVDGSLSVGYRSLSGADVYRVRPFSPSGTPLGAAVSFSGGYIPSIFTRLSDGSFASMRGIGIPFENDLLYVDSITSGGVVDTSGPFIENSYYYLGDQAIAADPAGGAWVAWEEYRGTQIKVRHFVPGAYQTGAITLSSATYRVGEGDGTLSVTLNRVGGSDGLAKVQFSVQDGTAWGGEDFNFPVDYPWDGNLEFADGETTRTLQFTILPNDVYEGNKTFSISISDPQNVKLGSVTTASVTIVEDDPKPVHPGSISLRDNLPGVLFEAGGNLSIYLDRSGGTDGIVSVALALTGNPDNSKVGKAFSLSTSLITFGDGESSKAVTLIIPNDSIPYGESQFTVAIVASSATGGAKIVYPSQHTMTLFDNDSSASPPSGGPLPGGPPIDGGGTTPQEPPYVQMVSARSSFNRKKNTSTITLVFDSPLSVASASNRLAYSLVNLGRDQRVGTKDDKKIKIKSASTSADGTTVVLTIAGQLPTTPAVLSSSSLRDTRGRLIDGDHDRLPGGDLAIRLSRKAVNLYAAPRAVVQPQRVTRLVRTLSRTR